jgi:hypothetical protein
MFDDGAEPEPGAAWLSTQGESGGSRLTKLQARGGKKDDWFSAAIALDEKLRVIGALLQDERTGAAYVVDL